MKRIYLASPLGFSEPGRHFMTTVLIPALVAAGVDVLDPWSLTDPATAIALNDRPLSDAKRQAWYEHNGVIAAANESALRTADGVFAVLDGAEIDSGTSSEIGFAAALGKPVIAYRSDFRMSGDNIGALVNLQVEFFVRRSGGLFIQTVAEIPLALAAADLAGHPRLSDLAILSAVR